MKAIMSDLLREILNNKESALALKTTLNSYRDGDEHTTFIYKGLRYKISLVRAPN